MVPNEIDGFFGADGSLRPSALLLIRYLFLDRLYCLRIPILLQKYPYQNEFMQFNEAIC